MIGFPKPSGFLKFFIGLICFGALAVGIIWFIVSMAKPNYIEVDEPLQPEIRLVVKDNNTIDTLYRYYIK